MGARGIWSRRLLIGIMVVTALLGIPRYATSQTETLIVGMQDDPLTLDPAMANQEIEFGLIAQLYEKLVTFTEDSAEPIPELAESWTVAEDGKTWTFQIRGGAVFANGNPLTAKEIVFSLTRALQLAGPSAWMLTQVGMTESGITALDDQTVQVVLSDAYAPTLVLACLLSPVASVVDPVVVMEHEQEGDMGSGWLSTNSAGSGRYVLSERIPGESTTLQVNEQYAGPAPVAKTVNIKIVQESIEQAIMLEKGEIDIAWNLLPSEIRRLETNPDVQIYQTPTLDIRFVGMNLTYEPFAKPEVRKAIRYAIDYDGIIDFIVEGAGEKIQTIIPRGILGYNPAMPYTLDREKATQLLTDAGYPDGFEVELACENYSPWTDIALQIKSDLAKVGITVTINELPTPDLFGLMFSRGFQMYLMHWKSDYFDPDANAKPFAHCDSAGDDASVQVVAWLSSYVNLETSKLVEQAVQKQDQAAREDLYTQITNIILDDGPYAVLFSPLQQYGVRFEANDALDLPSVFQTGFPMLR